MGIIFSLFYFFLAYIIGKFYEERGLNFYLGFFISLFLSPIFAIILGFLLTLDYSKIKKRKLHPEVTESFEFEEAKEVKEESPEERQKRVKREKRLLIIAIAGIIFLSLIFVFFLKNQLKHLREMDKKYRNTSYKISIQSPKE